MTGPVPPVPAKRRFDPRRPLTRSAAGLAVSLFMTVTLFMPLSGLTAELAKEQAMKTATGEFDVKLAPVQDTDFAAGRLTLDKTYHGNLEAKSKGQMLSHRSPVEGSAGYVAVETVTGSLDGRAGSFVLLHRGVMQGGQQELLITVSPDSGTGELAGLTGTMTIRLEDGKHFYDFDYGF